jgi:molybdenum cofactor synthesis domain-containing protein
MDATPSPKAPRRYRTTLIVVSDRAAAGTRPDATAGLLKPAAAERGFDLDEVLVVPDERARIADAIRSRVRTFSLVLTTGGTGVAPRDVTPEATREVIEWEVPGLVEEIRRRSAERNLNSIASRAVAGTAGSALVLNLPGRPEGAVEAFGFVAPVLGHLIDLLRGPVPDASHAPRT